MTAAATKTDPSSQGTSFSISEGQISKNQVNAMMSLTTTRKSPHIRTHLQSFGKRISKLTLKWNPSWQSRIKCVPVERFLARTEVERRMRSARSPPSDVCGVWPPLPLLSASKTVPMTSQYLLSFFAELGQNEWPTHYFFEYFDVDSELFKIDLRLASQFDKVAGLIAFKRRTFDPWKRKIYWLLVEKPPKWNIMPKKCERSQVGLSRI